MKTRKPTLRVGCFAVWYCLGCSNTSVRQLPSTPAPPQPGTPQVQPQQPNTFRGIAAYEDGTPAPGASIAITSLASGTEAAVITADRDGRFATMLEAGEYALAVTTEHGFSWVESTHVPNRDAKITLSRSCSALTGHAKGSVAGTQISLARKSPHTGDIFIANVLPDGRFIVCLPQGRYSALLRGPVVSFVVAIDLPAPPATPTKLEIDGYAANVIKQPPRDVVPVSATLDQLVGDIIQSDARLIGVGESTHGTAELVTSRATLTFELIRRADVRLVLFEVDAILATAIDDYVMGGNVDLSKAVASLGFWVTDTEELVRFFKDMREHNATARNKVRVWGIDVQNTKAPVSLLLAEAKSLKLTAEDKAMLDAVAEKRAAPVIDFSPARRAALDALLARLAKSRGKKQLDLRIETAARSLMVQVGYLDGDRRGLLGARRDAGMAALASFLVERTNAPRAVLWAHAGHVTRETDGGVPAMGEHLSAVTTNRYYPIGFYLFEGSVRAWDAAGAIGVISHPIPRAPDYTVEATVMAATGAPDIAWLPVRSFSASLRNWTDMPRYLREVGAVFYGEDDMLTLRNVRRAFDALVVIKSGNDSTPTPTGERKVNK
jgi:erythromycin esterase